MFSWVIKVKSSYIDFEAAPSGHHLDYSFKAFTMAMPTSLIQS